METRTLNQYAYDVRVGDIYNYACYRTNEAFLMYINDEYLGYVLDEAYIKYVLECIEYMDQDEIIRIIVKREQGYEKKRINDA
jgi:hypothetical protein